MKFGIYRNLQLRPAKPALGRGRIQRQVKRAFLLADTLTSSQVYDWTHCRMRHRMSQAHRWSVRRVLMAIADPIERVPPHGAWLWRLKQTAAGYIRPAPLTTLEKSRLSKICPYSRP
jgi:hypothetical protein